MRKQIDSEWVLRDDIDAKKELTIQRKGTYYIYEARPNKESVKMKYVRGYVLERNKVSRMPAKLRLALRLSFRRGLLYEFGESDCCP